MVEIGWVEEGKESTEHENCVNIHHRMKTSGASFVFLTQISVCSHAAPIDVGLFPEQ